MKPVTLLLLLVLSTGLSAQHKNRVVVDEKLQKEVLIGPCDRKGLESEIFNEYFQSEYEAYHIDRNAVEQIKDLKKGVEVLTVMGTWCHDSKMQVPRFYKIMDEAGIRESKLKLIAVDRAKTAGDTDISGLDVERVPTFIFYKKGREIGRIVESPTSSLEKDILLIFTMGL